MLASVTLLAGAASAGTFSPHLIGDTYVDAENEDKNFGSKETLWVTSDDGEPIMVTFLEFNKIGIKSADDIESAILKMYVTDVEEAGNVSAHFYKEGFFEDTLVWSGKPDYDEDADDMITIDEEGWCRFDVTELMKKAVAESECQTCPFSIVLVAEDNVSIGFASQEESDENKATLEFTTVD
ncbi:MAG: CBM96 family carbohydrate-binding protein [Methanotrichaceae archaeon]